jgi:uracil-DNA glycosylase
VIVCLGATAAQALMGPAFRVTRQRGQPIEGTPFAPYVVATVHPASILRAQDEDERAAQREAFVADLWTVRKLLDQTAGNR